MSNPEATPQDQLKEARALETDLARGDAAAFKEHLNHLYSEKGLDELRKVMQKVHDDEARDGVSVNVKDHGNSLPDVTILGADNNTHQQYVKFDAAQDGAYQKKDAQGHVTDFRTPDGREYHISYDADGQPSKISSPNHYLKPISFERTPDGQWKIPEQGGITVPADTVSVDGKTGTVTIKSPAGDATVTSADGATKKLDKDGHTVNEEVDASGKSTKYSYDAAGKPTETRTRQEDSAVTEVKRADRPNVSISEIKSPSGQVDRIEKEPDGSVKLFQGDKQTNFPKGSKVEINADGTRKITGTDGSSYEGKPDGTTVNRDSSGEVTRLTGPDGAVTTFKRDGSGHLSEMTVTNSAGKVLEHSTRDAHGWQSDMKDPAGHPAKVADISVNKDGSYAVRLDNGNKIERQTNGTEQFKDANGQHLETRAFKEIKALAEAELPWTDAQEKQLSADLAKINKMEPQAMREKIFADLEKLANGTDHTKITQQDRLALVTSLAHQIANPSSITQGDKNSCVMANTEQTLAKTHPDVYADAITSLALEGKYTAANGRTVEAQRNYDGSLKGVTDDRNSRSFSSELFQNMAANLAMKPGEQYVSYDRNSPGHFNHAAETSGNYPSVDGETVMVSVENNSKRDGEAVVSSSVSHTEMGDVKHVKVRDFDGFGASDQVKMLDALVPGEKHEARPINSVDDLKQALADNSLPMNVGVHFKAAPFLGMNDGDPGTGPDNHAVNITHVDYDKNGNPTKVYYDNPAGGANHSYPNGTGVPADQFVTAMAAGNQKAVVRKSQGNS